MGSAISSEKTRISAIVLNYLNYDQTILCVRDLLRQDYPGLDVVVVDNHSPNESLAKLKEAFATELKVVVLEADRNRGYAAGNNYGVRWRMGQRPVDYILIVNNDVRLPDTAALRRLLEFANGKEDLGGVGPTVMTPNGFPQGPYRRPHVVLRTLRLLFPIFPLLYRLWRRQVREKKPSLCYAIVGAFMLLKMEPFTRVNLFDERTFLGAEEYILAERLRKLGLRFYYYPLVTVVHNHAKSAIVRSGGEMRHFSSGLASMLYYFREYQQANALSLRLFEASARLYGRLFLPLRRRFTL